MSLLLALAASGLNGQNFAFVGYLPQDAGARTQRIRELEALALRTGQTQLFIETPYRNAALLQALLQALEADTRLAVGAALTLADARSRSAAWRVEERSAAGSNDTPAVFATAEADCRTRVRPMRSASAQRCSADSARAVRATGCACALHRALAHRRAELLGQALGHVLAPRVVDHVFGLDHVARHVVEVAQLVGQAQLDRLLAASRTGR